MTEGHKPVVGKFEGELHSGYRWGWSLSYALLLLLWVMAVPVGIETVLDVVRVVAWVVLALLSHRQWLNISSIAMAFAPNMAMHVITIGYTSVPNTARIHARQQAFRSIHSCPSCSPRHTRQRPVRLPRVAFHNFA